MRVHTISTYTERYKSLFPIGHKVRLQSAMNSPFLMGYWDPFYVIAKIGPEYGPRDSRVTDDVLNGNENSGVPSLYSGMLFHSVSGGLDHSRSVETILFTSEDTSRINRNTSDNSYEPTVAICVYQKS